MTTPSPTPFPERLSNQGAYLLALGSWPNRPTASTRVELPPNHEAPRYARQAIEEHLNGHVTPQEQQDLRLLVTEVVTNAVVHAPHAEGPDLHLAVSERCLRAEIRDRGSGFEPPAPPREASRAGGLGLVCVDRIATRWGISGEDGTCVWFEIDRNA